MGISMIHPLSPFVKCIEYHTQIEARKETISLLLFFFYNKTTSYQGVPEIGILFAISFQESRVMPLVLRRKRLMNPYVISGIGELQTKMKVGTGETYKVAILKFFYYTVQPFIELPAVLINLQHRL
jgi:hypothetical protein